LPTAKSSCSSKSSKPYSCGTSNYAPSITSHKYIQVNEINKIQYTKQFKNKQNKGLNCEEFKFLEAKTEETKG
jgi:hypothetical protein